MSSACPQSTQLAAENKLDEATSLIKLMDTMTEEKVRLTAAVEADTQATLAASIAKGRQMNVCEVCGAYLVVGGTNPDRSCCWFNP
jgi:hypothetical protein